MNSITEFLHIRTRLISVKKIVGQIPSHLQSILLVAETCAIFDFFLLPCFHNIDLGVRGELKVFAFNIAKVFSFDWLSENYGEKKFKSQEPWLFLKTS